MKNGMRPVHPGEVLREDFLAPLEMSANALPRHLHLPVTRVNDIVRERRGVSPDTAAAPGAFLRWRRAIVAQPATGVRLEARRAESRKANCRRDPTPF